MSTAGRLVISFRVHLARRPTRFAWPTCPRRTGLASVACHGVSSSRMAPARRGSTHPAAWRVPSPCAVFGVRRQTLCDQGDQSGGSGAGNQCFQGVSRRGCSTLEPIGYVVVRGEPIVAGELAGHALYESGDMGYCVTRLAERVLPQSVLYRYPFTDINKRLLWSAVAELLLNCTRRASIGATPHSPMSS